jgi:hypothetical protein
VVDDVEAILALRIVDAADIDDRDKAGIVAQAGDGLDNGIAAERQRQLAEGLFLVEHGIAHAGPERLGDRGERGGIAHG